MKWFKNALGLLALTSIADAGSSSKSSSESSKGPNIAEVLSTFSFTSTLLTVATLDDPFLAPVAARAVGDEPTTVFAPTNDAFAALGDELTTFLLRETKVLADVLLYHVVDGVIEADDIPTKETDVTTLLGEDVVAVTNEIGLACRISASKFCTEEIFINDSEVILADQEASNGIIHVIDEVLTFPGLLPTGDLVDTAAGAGLSLLVAAVQFADLEETLRSDGPFTVFAPIDDAFLGLGDILDFLLTEDGKGALIDVLLYHVVIGASVKSFDLSDGQVVDTALGQSVEISLDGGIFIIDTTDVPAEVIIADVFAFNGVAHAIDKVLIPADVSFSPTLVGVAASVDALSTLVAAVTVADLVETLQSDGPFTVFAPTNDAFAGLGEDLLGFLVSDPGIPLLTDILLYHVVIGAAVFADDISDGDHVDTALGESLTFEVTKKGLFIEDSTDILAEVIIPDVEASNGVAHVIDKVLIQPGLVPDEVIIFDLVETAVSVDALATLVAAVTFAELVETLQSDGPFTVFAPTNDAFAGLGEETLDFLLTEDGKPVLTDVLLYHVVVGAAVFFDDIENNTDVETALGESVTLFKTKIGLDRVFIKDSTEDLAKVIIADVEATNGVAHVIDKVLIPPS